ncbi:MAG: TerC family protein [Gammaproteobacteria bacterium]|nr:TerC family protein [Gammaproteobacteria bacterium]
MEMLGLPVFWVELGAIIWINLLVSGDNAVMIALAARSLPTQQQKLAVFWGSTAAVALRVILTIFAAALLALPWLKFAGGALLLWIGVRMLVQKKDDIDVSASDKLWIAVRTILSADLIMSLDNVIAVAAAANSVGSAPELASMKYVLLVLGLAISIPIVIFGSVMMLKIMERFPVIIALGAALLGWIAGEIMVTDPAIADWVQLNAAWLHDLHVAPIAGAVFVTAFGRWSMWEI